MSMVAGEITVQPNGLIKVTGTTAARERLTDQKGVLRHILWNGPTATGHKAELQDKDGNVVWADEFKLVFDTDGGTNSSHHDLNYNMDFNELYVADLDSGELLLVVDLRP
ncbi:MAG: hypothetical protein JRD68_00010 [Deltaproteobacteria bacterium]|nr:hypothetical protein [Deltaproteobacteria bacterium]